MTTTEWAVFQDFLNNNKKLLIMVADPKTDEIMVSFGGHNTFVRFPFTTMDKGVVFNALRKSKFNEAIDAFMTGVVESTGIQETDADGAQVLHVLGGSMRGLGIDGKLSQSKLEVKHKKNAKSKKK